MNKSFFAIIVLGFGILPSLLFSQNLSIILGRPTNSSVTVNLKFNSEHEVYCDYGVQSNLYDGQSQIFNTGCDNTLEFDLVNLLPDTKYYYRIRYKSKGIQNFSVSDEFFFHTQRAKEKSFIFTIEADPHPYDKKGCIKLWKTSLLNQLKDAPDFMIDMGDTFGDDHYPYSITNEQVRALQLDSRNVFKDACHSMPLFFCLGNHEGESGYFLLQDPPNNLAVHETLWRKLYYPNPYPNGFYSGCKTEEGYGMGLPENYYAWEWGDALFIVLDMYRYASASIKPQKWDWTLGKDQYDWLKTTLENSNAKFKFVFGHHILGQGRGGVELIKNFEWGGMDGGKDNFNLYRPEWDLPVHPLFVQNNVDVFFQGHDHLFVKQEADGIIYQTVPMPSDSTYNIGYYDNSDAFLSGVKLDGSGHLRVTVTKDSAIIDYVTALLPEDETNEMKNGQTRFSYVIKGNTTSNGTDTKKMMFNSEEWSVFPNPSDGSIYLSFANPVYDGMVVQVFGSNGNLFWQNNDPGDIKDSGRLPIGNLPAGLYLVNVFAKGRFFLSKKVIVY